jgi:Bacterial capsule synthesis protein PGA_cap
LHNYENSPTYYTRTYMRADARFIKDLQWMGINLMSCANNHSTHYGGVVFSPISATWMQRDWYMPVAVDQPADRARANL